MSRSEWKFFKVSEEDKTAVIKKKHVLTTRQEGERDDGGQIWFPSELWNMKSS